MCDEKNLNKSKGKVKVFGILLFGIAAVIVVFILMPFRLHFMESGKQNSTVANVNGASISYAEFKKFLDDEKGNVYSYFKQKIGVDDGEDFWTNVHNGEVPIQVARENTLNKLVRIKIEHMLAQKLGLIHDISYEAFLEDLKNENERRKVMVSKGQPIYGPVQFKESTYFSYTYSNMLIKLKERLAQNEIAVTEEEMNFYYNSNKEKYRIKDDIKIEKISIGWVDKEGRVDQSKRPDVKKKIEKVVMRINNGESFGNAYKDNEIEGVLNSTFEEQIFDMQTEEHDEELYPRVYPTAKMLEVGQLSGVLEEGNSFVIIKVLEKKYRGYSPLADIRNSVKLRILEEKYDEYMESLIKDANVKINYTTYDKILGS